jgi:hypothetical protein
MALVDTGTNNPAQPFTAHSQPQLTTTLINKPMLFERGVGFVFYRVVGLVHFEWWF